MSILQDIQIFYGAATNTSAQVYAQVKSVSDLSGLRLTGCVRGPRAEEVRTLPTSIDLADLGPGQSLLARAVVPDPSFWSPDVPAVYDVTVELRDQQRIRETVKRSLGIRHFGARGSSLYLAGRRWVLRGIMADRIDSDDVDLLLATNASIVSFSPSQKLCEIASRRGVVVAALLPGSESSIRKELLRLSLWPAVAVAIIDRDVSPTADLKSAAPNIELAQLRRAGQPGAVASWATVAACLANDTAELGELCRDEKRPVLAIQSMDPKMRMSDRRAACDLLQRDLAPFGDFAGYIV